jgi:hypothetical protein
MVKRKKVRLFKLQTKYADEEMKTLYAFINYATEIYMLSNELPFEDKLVQATLELLKIRIIKTVASQSQEYRFTFRHNEKLAFCIAYLRLDITSFDTWAGLFLHSTFTSLHRTL